MTSEPDRIEEIFVEASAMAEGTARAAFLDQACGGDGALRERVEALLAAHDSASSFLKLPDESAATTAGFVRLSEGPGAKIGRYKLLEQIGEGGFGVVFMAEQEEPVRRRVALKIIKAGMDTRQVVARFEAERQALAMMDHPNIARVFDAGTTGEGARDEERGASEGPASTPTLAPRSPLLAAPSGRPYFVMELVKGIPITEYCDQHKLSTDARLALFMAVCSAVQHAHQKGIIHRDLKPSNVMVTLHDDKPVPKIIDFGIAKATQARLTEKTLFTEYRQLIGTPAYMSPEQAQMSGLDVDTRSDIYSLGVLLYELLTGTTPFDTKELLRSGYDEMRRIIREVEPPRPSTRLSQVTRPSSGSLPLAGRAGEGGCRDSATIAANRGVDPKQLSQQLRGDLDWIVMKCLEKDRNRRYETANGLSRDIECHLRDEPVQACPPSVGYRLNKLVRRNKVGVVAGAAIASALMIGLVLASIGFIQASKQAEIARAEAVRADREAAHARAQAARSEKVSQFLRDLLGSWTTNVDGRDTTLLRETVAKATERVSTELKNQPDVEADLLDTISSVYFQIGPIDTAERLARKALSIRRRLYGKEHLEVANSLLDIGGLLWRQGKLEEAEDWIRQAMEMNRKLSGPNNRETVVCQIHLGGILTDEKRAADAELILKDAVERTRQFRGDDRWMFGWSLIYFGRTLDALGKYDEAENALRESVETYRVTGTTAHPQGLSESLHYLGDALLHSGKLLESEAALQEAIALSRRQRDPARDPFLAWQLNSLAQVLKSLGRLSDAEAALREAFEIQAITDADNPHRTNTFDFLIDVLNRQGKTDEAETLIRESTNLRKSKPQPTTNQSRLTTDH